MSERHPYNEESALPPRFVLDVPDGTESMQFSVSLMINEADASCWRRPVGIFIAPYGQDYDSDAGVALTRNEVRLLRDFLSSLLEVPDWRHDPAEDQ